MLFQPELFKKFNIKGSFSEKIPKEKIPSLFPQVLFPKQVHSDKVLLVDTLKTSLLGDGVITTKKNLILGVQTADCLPILITDKFKRVVGAIHAGWRGTLSEILKKALEKILLLGIKSEEILIAIGPHIQSSCYEVGEEVIDLLPERFKKPPFLIKNGSSFYLDLSLLNLFQAKDLGIPESNFWISKECTHCEREKYHSFRREKNYLYSQIALISLEDV